ncbi:hypothetical protein B0H19DRAFT_1068242 [Mycena capillaripes]|nr:hypothetical protein B0H19DRAFT_1068242 [Mycena capillaripes]
MSEAGRMVVVGKREGRGASVTAVKLIYGNCDVIDSAVFGTNYRALLDDSRLPPESSQAASRLAFLASAWDSFLPAVKHRIWQLQLWRLSERERYLVREADHLNVRSGQVIEWLLGDPLSRWLFLLGMDKRSNDRARTPNAVIRP